MTVLPTGFAESMIAQGFESPTAMAVASDGRIFVAEQAGRLRVVKNGRLLSSPFVTVDTQVLGEASSNRLELVVSR
jgi:glucose/arabinose dehydrogenase